MADNPMSKSWLLWKKIDEHPVFNPEMHRNGASPPRVFVWGQKLGDYHFGRVYNYGEGEIRARAEGFHGEWNITHYAECPDGPDVISDMESLS